MPALSVSLTPTTPQNAPSHSAMTNVVNLDHNYFTPNGPDTAGVVFGDGFGNPLAATRAQYIEGSDASPIVGDGVHINPSLLVSRRIRTPTTTDFGGIWVAVKSLVGGGTQVNGITNFIDQYASRDALNFGAQVVMENVGGAGFAAFSNTSNAPHTCTITNASPAQVTIAGHDLHNDHEIKFYSAAATLPTGLTNLARYFVSVESANTFYVSTLPSTGILSISVASPTHIVTDTNHGLNTGDFVWIAGTTTTPSVNGLRQVTVVSPTEFTIPVNVTVGENPSPGTVSFKLVNTSSAGAGTFYASGNAVWGYNPVIINSSNMPLDYDGGAGVAMSAVIVQPLGTTRGGNALRVLGSATGPLSEGLVFDASSVYGQTLYDLSSSLTALYIAGSHQIGLDLSAGSFSQAQIKLGAGAGWTPTVTASAGALTTVSAGGEYVYMGKYLRYSVTIIVTNNGTGSGSLQFTLPNALTAHASFISIGQGVNANTASGLRTVSQAGGNNVSIVRDSDGAYPVTGAGQTLYVSGWIGLA